MTAPCPQPITTAIQVQGLRKSYGRLKTVLDGIDLSVAPGQVFGYVGPNGAGKTTTVKILAGMLGGYEGEVRVAGFDVREETLEVKRCIGYLPENAQLYEALTVMEHLLLVGRLQGLADEVIVERGSRMLAGFELKERAGSRIGSLSKGMRQKVMIVSALIHDPAILYFDEPLSGLDVHSTVLIKELLRELAQQGKTILYCSHMMDVVERVCDRIAILDKGHIVAEGSFDDLAARSEQGDTLERVFMQLTAGEGASDNMREILAALRSEDGR